MIKAVWYWCPIARYILYLLHDDKKWIPFFFCRNISPWQQ
jgi:hypothetical protein